MHPPAIPVSRFEVLAVIVLALLVLTSVAIPHYAAAPGVVSTGTDRPEALGNLPQAAPAAQPGVLPAKTIVPSLQVAPVANAWSISPATAQQSVSEKTREAAARRATRQSPVETMLPAATVRPVALHDEVAESAGTLAPATTTTGSASAAMVKADGPDSPPVTVTGCLEISVDHNRFRLTDTEGTDVPKARSWRSGFLKKRAAPVELVGLSDPLTARKYVGNRVVATGQLEDREMRVRSLQATSAACDQ